MKSKWSKRAKHDNIHSTLNSSTSTLSSVSNSSTTTTTITSTTNALTLKTKASESTFKAECASTASTSATNIEIPSTPSASSSSSALASPSNQNGSLGSREFPYVKLTAFINECINKGKSHHYHQNGLSPSTSSSPPTSEITATFTNGTSETDSTCLTFEELDDVQKELESLLSKTSIRIRALKNAQQRFLNDNDGSSSSASAGRSTNKKNSQASVLQRSPPVTRKLNAQAISSAISAAIQMRHGVSSPSSSPTKLKLGTTRYKKKVRGAAEVRFRWASDRPTRGQYRAHSLTQEVQVPRQPAHFWDFTDEYCRDLTYDDLETLERTIQEHNSPDEMAKVLEIPPLGKHFRDTENTKTTRSSREKALQRFSDVTGPLTQRLVSALVDNRIHIYHCLKDGNGSGDDVSHMEGLFMNRPGLANSLGIDNGVLSDKSEADDLQPHRFTLEAKLKKVLIEQGFLPPSSDPDNGNDDLFLDLDDKDEILTDILRTQDTLRSLHKHNAEKLKQLQILARRELVRSQVKLDMEKADKEIMEAYRLISSSRSKKKPLTKREKELAHRALEHRKVALEKLHKPVALNMELMDQ